MSSVCSQLLLLPVWWIFTSGLHMPSREVTTRATDLTAHDNMDVPVRFLPARRYASAGYRDRNVSVRLSVRPSVRPSRAGIVSKRRKLAA